MGKVLHRFQGIEMANIKAQIYKWLNGKLTTIDQYFATPEEAVEWAEKYVENHDTEEVKIFNEIEELIRHIFHHKHHHHEPHYGHGWDPWHGWDDPNRF